ncbi:MAG: nitroreductase family protein [Actinobacteria bacterium]|nr:nitroreductase family protein [Actinomycetota bacterium]
MEVLEAIQKRRTVRTPFDERRIPTSALDTLLETSNISPSGDPISWQMVTIEDHTTKSELVQIVEEDFGDAFQRDSDKFREVFSKYPQWLRFSKEAKDGIALLGFPEFAKHFYRLALSKRLGPLFGKLGIMNREIELYCSNIVSNPLIFGVFLNRRVKVGPNIVKPIINAGGMLQNMRLAATSLGLSYQDLGWITATKSSSERARRLLNIPENYTAINFFRVGYPNSLSRESKKSDFRRDLAAIVHLGKFGSKDFAVIPIKRARIGVLDAIRGNKAERAAALISKDELGYILEAARWAPTGFNVQPFEFVVIEHESYPTIAVLENRERKDPDPGPCEALARGGVLQNIRLASRALGVRCEIKQLANAEADYVKRTLYVPNNYSMVGLVRLKEDKNG